MIQVAFTKDSQMLLKSGQVECYNEGDC